MSYDQFKKEPDTDSLVRLTALAEELENRKNKVAQLDDELKRELEQVKRLEEREIPELMDLIGIAQFRTADGTELKIEEKLRASIPKDRTGEAVEWLEKNGHSGIVKCQIFAMFDKGAADDAELLAKELAQRGFTAGQKYEVHPQTLAKLCRDFDKSGVDYPEDVFGVFRQRLAKFSRE